MYQLYQETSILTIEQGILILQMNIVHDLLLFLCLYCLQIFFEKQFTAEVPSFHGSHIVPLSPGVLNFHFGRGVRL